MVTHTCECCNYSTKYIWVYKSHLLSKKHLKFQTSTQEYSHVCEYCTKKYRHASGLCKHKKNCKNLPPPVNILLERIAQLENKVLENQTINNNIVNNNNCNNTTNNNNNIINIHLTYLNTHCNNALNIDQFVESVSFGKNELLEIDKQRFFINGAMKVLKQQLDKLSTETLPIHCSATEKNRPTNFYIRDNDQWTQESHDNIEYQIKYGDFDESEEEKPRMMRFIEKYTQDFYEEYVKLSKKDQKHKSIDDKMAVSGQSKTHIEMLRQISDIESLVLDPPSVTNTDSDPVLLAT